MHSLALSGQTLSTPQLLVNERVKESLPACLSAQIDTHQSSDIGRMVNYIAIGTHVTETSKSSMRWYRLKCIYMHFFYAQARPFGSDELMRTAGEDKLFIKRFLRKSSEAGRFVETSDGWVPTPSAIRRAEGLFGTSGFNLTDSSTYFNVSVPWHYQDFSIKYSTLILQLDPRATVLGMAVEWALWEAELDGGYGLTANRLSTRLEVNKSSLSAAILKLYQLNVISEMIDPMDGRAKILSLSSAHPLYLLKKQLIQDTLGAQKSLRSGGSMGC